MEDYNTSAIRNFYKHSNLHVNVSITIKGLTDNNNTLNINMCSTIPEYHDNIADLKKKYDNLTSPRCSLNKIQLNAETNQPKPTSPARNDKKEIIHPIKNNPFDIDYNCFRKNYLSECSIFIEAQLCNNGKLLEPPLITGRLKALNFYEHSVFPINYSDLTLDATISITIYDMNKPPDKAIIGGTCISLFNNQHGLRQGNYALLVYKGQKGDPNFKGKTIGLAVNELLREKNTIYTYIDKYFIKEMQETYNKSTILDGVAFKTASNMLQKIDSDAHFATLEISVPMFDHPVIWMETKYPKKDIFISASKFDRKLIKSKNLTLINKTSPSDPLTSAIITLVYDPMVVSKVKEDYLNISNPIANKHYMLSRVVDANIAKELRPNHEEMQSIEETLSKPDFHEMSAKEIWLIWTYRYYLQTRREAIIKMLLSANWSIEKEEKEALFLLNSWAPIESEQAIMMLSSLFPAHNTYRKMPGSLKAMKLIRKKAIAYLRQMKDEDLEEILIQLVQAYRYEDPFRSELKDFLIETMSKNEALASSLMWCVRVETENKSNETVMEYYKHFYNELIAYTERIEGNRIHNMLLSQIALRDRLLEINLAIKASKTKADEKIKILREMISGSGKKDMTSFDPVPVPVNPHILTNGVNYKACSVFRSKTYPMKISFKQYPTSSNEEYNVIFKEGDDLRQDQLILQMFALMNNLIKKVGLDLNFNVYKIVAAGKKDGFSEFVTESKTIHDIKDEYKSGAIIEFLTRMSAEKRENIDVILDRYLRSCAGYCAVTYLLGIGDRHLENLMIRKNGEFFHIDFGFILGKDPKIWPPPIRICKEMVVAMGGENSENFKRFCRMCVDTFLYLRKYAKLFVNLFFLMLHSGIKDLSEKDANTTLMKLYERFMPEKDAQDAEQTFLNLIYTSVNAIFASVLELAHDIANYWK